MESSAGGSSEFHWGDCVISADITNRFNSLTNYGGDTACGYVNQDSLRLTACSNPVSLGFVCENPNGKLVKTSLGYYLGWLLDQNYQELFWDFVVWWRDYYVLILWTKYLRLQIHVCFLVYSVIFKGKQKRSFLCDLFNGSNCRNWSHWSCTKRAYSLIIALSQTWKHVYVYNSKQFDFLRRSY